MSLVVAEEGNRRVGDMNADETSQCVLDIKAWFMRTRCRDDINPPASSPDIQRFEKTVDISLPKAIKILLMEADGGLYFMDRKQLSLAEIQDFIENNEKSRNWRGGLVPICGDDSGALVVDTAKYDAVREWDADDGLGDEVSSNISRYLESYRNDLLSGHFEYVDGMGVIEKMTGKPRK